MDSPHRLTVWRKADLLAQRICVTIPCDATAPHADLAVRLRATATDIPLEVDAAARAALASDFADHTARAITLTHDLRYLLVLNHALGRLASTECARLQARTDQVQRMLAGLLRAVEPRRKRPAANGRVPPETDDRATTRRRPPSAALARAD